MQCKCLGLKGVYHTPTSQTHTHHPATSSQPPPLPSLSISYYKPASSHRTHPRHPQKARSARLYTATANQATDHTSVPPRHSPFHPPSGTRPLLPLPSIQTATQSTQQVYRGSDHSLLPDADAGQTQPPSQLCQPQQWQLTRHQSLHECPTRSTDVLKIVTI